MVLNDVELANWADYQKGLSPFDFSCVNPASIDLKIGPSYKDLAISQDKFMIDGYVDLVPGRPILASTSEYIRMPEDCSGVLYLKSSMARLGLDHALAGWIDPGFEGELTLELHAHIPIRLRAFQRVCQIVLYRMVAVPSVSYKLTGRYNGQRGPTEAR